MNNVLLCTNHTENPFYIREINKNIYSIEELSYYLYNYLYLVDDSFYNDALISYIESELKLPNIAAGIRQIVEKGGSLGEKIAFVIKNSGYYDEKEIEKLENHLVGLSSKTNAERIKAKADILMDSGKYNMAISYYNSILGRAMNTDLPRRFYGDVYNNLAVAYARLFDYEHAATNFRCAYRLNESVESLESIIRCDIILGKDERLKVDQEKYHVSGTVVNRIRNEVETLKERIKYRWDESKEEEYVKNCKKEYVIEVR